LSEKRESEYWTTKFQYQYSYTIKLTKKITSEFVFHHNYIMLRVSTTIAILRH